MYLLHTWFFQVEGVQDMSMAGGVAAVEQKEEYDPLSIPDVDKLVILRWASVPYFFLIILVKTCLFIYVHSGIFFSHFDC